MNLIKSSLVCALGLSGPALGECALYSTVQYSTVLYCAVLYCTALYSTLRYISISKANVFSLESLVQDL